MPNTKSNAIVSTCNALVCEHNANLACVLSSITIATNGMCNRFLPVCLTELSTNNNNKKAYSYSGYGQN